MYDMKNSKLEKIIPILILAFLGYAFVKLVINDCILGKKIYNQNPTEEKVYMIAMSIGTIIKEYGWGNDYVTNEGIYRLANRIA